MVQEYEQKSTSGQGTCNLRLMYFFYVDIISTPDDLLPWVTLAFAGCAAWWIRKKESKKDD